MAPVAALRPVCRPLTSRGSVTTALVTTIEDLFDVQIPRLDLAEQARAWELTVDEMGESEPEMAEYVTSLEEAADAAELPEASGDALAREFERYLRGRQEG